ncbi:SDR family oxidoreductase [Amycolatopsis taiwanensis]|uniref:Short-chain dehydrogenase n=1 Tax=Amycolatopsis taiwanensis TaxID=342230 RepID=A0A9W6R8H0_9PSEU|nr:SDR family oxidoreductase [Amycolatopsis taiwanensis]GLY71284.1 short-chain dehydrogenase [Amycolatopsis taiwanensis]
MSNGLLENKVALVCGVGPDLGRSLALRSAHAGADVVLAARDENRLRAVAEEIEGTGRKSLVVPTDITDEESLTNLLDQTLGTFGRVDAFLNSAFIPRPQERLLDTDLSADGRWHQVNVLAPVRLVQKLAPALIESKGSVVLINSMVIRNRLPHFGTYRMDKAALLAAARSLSVELGPHGVRVNSVAPGYIWAGKVQALFGRIARKRGVDAQQVYDEAAAGTDLRRLPTAEEIADAAVFLASDMASGITGECIDVNCGATHH